MASILILSILLPCTGLATSPGSDAGADPDHPLRVGLLPFASPVSLFQRFGPLRDYLAHEVGQPFSLESARNFSVHVQRIEAGHYDFVLTAPHFVLIALDSGHYELVGSHRDELYAVFLVSRDDKATGLMDLANRVIATPPRESLISVFGRGYLLQVLDSFNKEPEFVAYPSHTAAIHAVSSGLAEAAIASINVARGEIDRDVPVRILGESDRFPGTAVLLHTRLPPDLRRRITEVLVSMPDREDGQVVLRRMDYSGYRPATAETYERFRMLLPETRRHLEPPQPSP